MPTAVSDVRTVAIIGAGISGLVAAKYLTDANLTVTVFERASSLGGIWVYNDCLPPDPPYPNNVPSLAEADPHPIDRIVDVLREGEHQAIATLQARHAPPGPSYESLRNNIPTCLMSFKDQSWPEGTNDYVRHDRVLAYIRNFAHIHNVENLVKFNSRVLRVAKLDASWFVEACTLQSKPSGRLGHSVESQVFDAVVICSGHHSAARVPDIPGLAELHHAWPRHIIHSMSYRRPCVILGQNIVLVGNGASAYDIAHELKQRANKIYQVAKANSGYIPLQFMPAMVERVAEISSVESTATGHQADGHIPNTSASPTIRVYLVDGQVLDDIDSIVLCTGYIRSYPFLAQYHNDYATCDIADDTVLITDGSMLHNLHKDVFYIPQPTLSFVGIPSGTTSLALFEYQAMAIASVWSGQAHLPCEAEMRAEYQTRLHKKGTGRNFHSLQAGEVEYVQELVEWLNSSRKEDLIKGYSQSWLATLEKRKAWLKEIFKKPHSDQPVKPAGEDVAGICTPESGGYLERR